MTEREHKALLAALEGILMRHSGEDKKAVAAALVDTVVQAYDRTETDGTIN